jgi:hypothetical protein
LRLLGLLLLMTCSIGQAACTSGSNSSDAGTPDGDQDHFSDDGQADADQLPTNAARVFEISPIATPNPAEVSLDWAADDLSGALTSTAGTDGLRKLRVFSCVDEGRTNTGIDFRPQRICTLRQLANKIENGNFIYQDWDNAISGVFDPLDIHAEVSLFYHAQKFYRFITSTDVGLFDRIPGRHEVGQLLLPINLVANYRLPGADGLQALPMAMYFPNEHMQMGMADIYGLLDYQGDFLVFGQGPQADFAYDGETVYHEFGHLMNRATAGLEYKIWADQYGLCNLTNALEQGLAETFVFLVSGHSTLFSYLDQVSATGGFERDVDNLAAFPRDMRGIDQFDGLIIAGANFEAFKFLKEQAALSPARFARLLLLALSNMADPQAMYTFTDYAESFLEQLSAEGLAQHTQSIRTIFEERGLFQAVRAKDISAYRAADRHSLFFGGTLDRPWNTWMTAREGDQSIDLAPAYIQAMVDTPASVNSLQISAYILALPDSFGMYPSPDDWDVRLYVRQGQPVIYEQQVDGQYIVQRDLVIEPVVEKRISPYGEVDFATWTIDSPNPQTRYYLHFVNLGSSPGMLLEIDLALQ